MLKNFHGIWIAAAVSVLATDASRASSRLYDMNIFLPGPQTRSSTIGPDLAAAENAPAPLSIADIQTAAGGPQAESEGLGGILSEVRVGVLKHDIGPFSRSEEEGIDGNIEFLFVSPRFLDVVWSPRPHVGMTINSGNDTNQAYFGLSWEFDVWRHLFAGFSFGGSVHDGETITDRTDKKELGCRLLFRESLEAGWRFAGHHAVTAFFDHISNGRLCDKNEGLENLGVRYGYRF